MAQEKKKTNANAKKRDQYTIVLEDIRSQNRVVAESIMGLHEKMDDHAKDIEDLKSGVEYLKADVELIKGEVAIIRHNQVSRDEFKLLETRVARLERLRKR